MEPLPSYNDLVWLFEAEPAYPHADGQQAAGDVFGWREPWPYTAVTFQTSRGGFDIEMYIEPAYEVVRLRLRTTVTGAELLYLDLQGVRSIRVQRANGRASLRLDFPDDVEAGTLWLRMKPDVTVRWTYHAAV